MFKVLLPFDGSENALRALKHVIRMAKALTKLSVHLVHAHEAPLVYGGIAVYTDEEKIAELQRQHSAALLVPAQELLRGAKIPFETEILIGPIAERIANRAKELGCDSIVMGTRGMGSIGNLVMGSISTKVIHLATMPVVLVK